MSTRILFVPRSCSHYWHSHKFFSLLIFSCANACLLFRASNCSITPHFLWFEHQMRPTIEYCRHVWDGVSFTALFLLDGVQRKVVRWIKNPLLISNLQSLRYIILLISFSFLFFKTHFSSSSTFSRSSRTHPTSHPYQDSLSRYWTSLFQFPFIPGTARLWDACSSYLLNKRIGSSSMKLRWAPYQLTLPIRWKRWLVQLFLSHSMNCRICSSKRYDDDMMGGHNHRNNFKDRLFQ